MSLTTPSKIRELQIKLYRKAKNERVTRCLRKALARFRRNGCSAPWAFSGSKGRWARVRESAMKPVGKPDAGNPHVRFDERGWEPGRRFVAAPAPILDSTDPDHKPPYSSAVTCCPS